MTYVLGAVEITPAKTLQQALKSMNFYSGAIDGALGPASAKAAGRYVEQCMGMLAAAIKYVHSKGKEGPSDSILEKLVADSVSIKIPNAVSSKNFAALDKIRDQALHHMKVLDGVVPGTLTKSTASYMSLGLDVSSDRRPASAPTAAAAVEPTPTAPVTLPGGISVPKVVAIGAALAAVAWFVTKK